MIMKLLVAVAFLLAGCAPASYVKKGATEEDFKRDKYDCAQLAGSTAAGNPMIYNDVFKDCMINKHGWSIKE